MGLYRTILKEPRNRLPEAMRGMGDAYVRNEFVLHFKAKPEHVRQFYSAWEDYLSGLRRRGERFGVDLTPEAEKAMSDTQRTKLKELREEARKFAQKE